MYETLRDLQQEGPGLVLPVQARFSQRIQVSSHRPKTTQLLPELKPAPFFSVLHYWTN